ncbi:MAG: pyridoxal-phosphate dependent enzyme [Bacteroidales bacterium]|nr:pyridoxal-phosphate dependent enzyme [Bacteroidales bacterium]
MDSANKYQLRCVKCGHTTKDFATWFAQNQCCPQCNSKHAEIEYSADYAKLEQLFMGQPQSFWHYFDFLPLYDKKNIVSFQEGAIPLERWTWLEHFAGKNGIDCEIYVYRNDLNGGTNTFKDIAASMAASVFSEIGLKHYCIASTGNTATAYGKYLAKANISAAIFMPENAVAASMAEISSYGQQVYCVKGDYSDAKKVAADYAAQYHVPISAGNIDPIRVESKRTMVFEWLRMLKKMPDVYVQAISGGTGPLALDKAVRELSAHRDICLPKMLLVQTDKCDPMVQAWEKAKQQNFPEGFQNDYPVIKNPQTKISILGTGNPGTYPIVAKLMQKCNGDFIRVAEDKVEAMAKVVAIEQKTHIGPASAVCFLGLIDAIVNKRIQSGQTVLVNMGEGIKRAPEFLLDLGHHIKHVDNVSQCEVGNIDATKDVLWNDLLK